MHAAMKDFMAIKLRGVLSADANAIIPMVGLQHQFLDALNGCTQAQQHCTNSIDRDRERIMFSKVVNTYEGLHIISIRQRSFYLFTDKKCCVRQNS